MLPLEIRMNAMLVVDGFDKRTRSATDFLHDDAMCLVAHGEPTVVFIRRDTQEPFSRSGTAFIRCMRSPYPASPNFLHISFGNSLWLSVLAASSSGISRSTTHSWLCYTGLMDVDLLVNSCTRSLNSVRSSVEGGKKPAGCLVEAARLKVSVYSRGLALQI